MILTLLKEIQFSCSLQKNCAVHKFPRTDDEEPYKPFTPIKDGQTFELDGITLKAFHTPGHTTDSIILHLLVNLITTVST